MQSARPRFSLFTLLIAITLFACALGMWRYSPGFVMGLALISVPIVAWILLLAVTSPARPTTVRTRRQQMRAKRFWRAFWVTMPFAAFWNLIPYWYTYDAPGFDGDREIGLPLIFHRSNWTGNTWFGPQEFFVDAFTLVIFSLFIAHAMRSGRQGVCLRVKKFLRGRT